MAFDQDRRPTFTNRDKMRAAQREAGFRRSVYERRVAAGKMTRDKADSEIALMDAIAADYGALAQADAEAAEPSFELDAEPATWPAVRRAMARQLARYFVGGFGSNPPAMPPGLDDQTAERALTKGLVPLLSVVPDLPDLVETRLSQRKGDSR